MKIAYKPELREALTKAVRNTVESMKSAESSYVKAEVSIFKEDTYATEIPSFQVQADQYSFLVCTPERVLIIRIPAACKIKLPELNLPELDSFADMYFAKDGNAQTMINAAFVAKGYKLATKVAQKMAVRKGDAFPPEYPCKPLQGVHKDTNIRLSKAEKDVIKASTFIKPMLCIWLDEESTLNPSKDDFVFAGNIDRAVSLIVEKAVEVNEFYSTLMTSNEYAPDTEKATVSKELTCLNGIMDFLQSEKFKASAIYASTKGYVSWYQAFLIGTESYINAFVPMMNDVEAIRKNKKAKLDKPERIEVFTKMCQALELDSATTNKEELLRYTVYMLLVEVFNKPEVSIFKEVIDYALPLVKIVDGHAKRLNQLLSFNFVRPIASGKAKAGSRYAEEKFFTHEAIVAASMILAKIALYGGVYDKTTGKWSGETVKTEAADSGV